MNSQELQDFMKIVTEEAYERLFATGGVQPTAYLLKGRTALAIKLRMETDETKELSRELIKKVSLSMGAEAAVLVTEAWTVIAPKEGVFSGPVSRHPERKECVICSGSNSKETITIITVFERKEEGMIILGTSSTQKGMSDSFTGFMREESTRLKGNA